MRAAVIVCELPCVKGQLDYTFREDYESSSGGPSLNPTWGEGTFDSALGPYRCQVLPGHCGFWCANACLDAGSGKAKDSSSTRAGA